MIEEAKRDLKEIMEAIDRLAMEHECRMLESVPRRGGWSVAQVLHHLSGYNDYYLAQIRKAILTGPKASGKSFRSGWLGGRFTKMMRPRDGKVVNKMKAFRNHIPPGQAFFREEWERFVSGERELLRLLADAEKIDLSRARVPISISRFVRLKLGDTIRFLIAHQQRHLLQIRNTVDELEREGMQQLSLQ